MEIISIDDLHDEVQKMGGNNLILDVRSAEEYSAGHIEGSQNTPHEEVSGIAEDLKGYDKVYRSEEHTSEFQSRTNLVCRLLLEKKKKT